VGGTHLEGNESSVFDMSAREVKWAVDISWNSRESSGPKTNLRIFKHTYSI